MTLATAQHILADKTLHVPTATATGTGCSPTGTTCQLQKVGNVTGHAVQCVTSHISLGNVAKQQTASFKAHWYFSLDRTLKKCL
ncbi:hypothetical protein [Aeromonas sp. AE23HZ002T15]